MRPASTLPALRRGSEFVSDAFSRAFRSLFFWMFVAVFIGIIGVWTLPQPNTMVSASMRTETVELRVTNPERIAFTVPKALVNLPPGQVCRDDLAIFPQSGAALYFSRQRHGTLTIFIDGNVAYETMNGPLNSKDQLVLEVSDKGDCAIENGLRVPFTAKAVIGIVEAGARSVGEPSLVLNEGLLKIFGRATPKIFGIPVEWIKPLPLEGNRLYRAGEFRIPPGSQVGSPTAEWWGFLDIPFDGSPGFSFEATSNTESLYLSAPAPRAVRNSENASDSLNADVISMTFGARLSNDPNLRWVFAAISFILLLVSVIFQVIETRDEL